MKSDSSHGKLTCGRVISTIFILSVLLSSWVLLSEKAIKLGRFIQHSLQNSEESIDALINNEDEEFGGLKFRISEIHKKLMESQMADFSELRAHIQIFLRDYRNIIRSKNTFEELAKSFFFTYIDEAEYLYKKCIDNLKIEVSDSELCTFALSVTSNDKGGLGDILRSIEKHVLPQSELQPYGVFFGTMRNYFMDTIYRHCEQVSIQQSVYEFFELLVRNEKLAFSAYKLSYSILTQCYQENYTDEEESALEEIIRRIQEYTALISAVMTDLPRDVRRCFPPPGNPDGKFLALDDIDLSIPMNQKKVISWDGCMSTCNNISEGAISIETMDTEDIINMTACDTCESLESSHLCRRIYHMVDDFPIPLEPVHVGYERPRKSLIRTICEHILFKKKQHGTLNFTRNSCNDCVCKCTNSDMNIKSRYAISLRPQESDVSKNMIVTGIRFNKTNYSNGMKVIYPQIKVAKLSPKGLLEGVWKDVRNFDNSSWLSGEAGVDYAIIGSGENRSMMITSDINSGKLGYVVTGVKFQLRYDRYRKKRYEGDVEKSFEIVVRMTPCNFTTGHLSASESIYTDPDAEMASTINNDLESKMPTRTRIDRHNEYTWNNTYDTTSSSRFHYYVEISQIDERHDVGKTIQPLFNLQSVDPTPAFPLSEINIFCDDNFIVRPAIHFIEFRVKTVSITELLGFQRYKNLSAIVNIHRNFD